MRSFQESLPAKVGNGGRGSSQSFFLAILVIFLGAQKGANTIQPNERGERPPVLLLDDFYYPPQNNTLAYPTCKLTKGFEFPGQVASDLGDYAFLSVISYETSDVNKYILDKWFGGSEIVVDEEKYVTQYRKDSNTAANPVYFKLFSLPSVPGYAVMSIRGSETPFDWLVNMQLWSASGLAQVVKWLTPFGWVWEPILPDLIKLVNMIESKSIGDASYYKVTTQFVNDVMAGYGKEFGKQFSTVQVTGASLGGGLAIITGAQTNAFAIAISGPGATLSRKSFDPPVELEKLNTQTFNFIPARDYVARVGGRASLFQNAQCTAPKNDLFGCHFLWRSVCEITYSCGSSSRPVPCICVDAFGYPPPVQNGTRSFTDACKEEENNWYEMFPPS